MTNHSESNDMTNRRESSEVAQRGELNEATQHSGSNEDTRHSGSREGAQRGESSEAARGRKTSGLAGPVDETLVTLRTPAELADALPYLLGFRPEESIVLIALHGERGRFGGRVRLGIPGRAEDWPSIAEQLAQCLVSGCERRGAKPDGVVAFLCAEPVGGESGAQVMARLRSLAQVIRTSCGGLDVPVFEVVCISAGRFWTYCCPNQECCPPEGVPLLEPGTSVLAAATAYAGVQVGATPREMRARLTPWVTAGAADQEAALDAAGMAIVRRLLEEEGEAGTSELAAETLDLARRVMARLDAAPSVTGTLESDLRDDELLAHDEAAALILGLQDRTTRDRAAEWMEGDDAAPALRLWRALARRCVGAYGEHAAAPLSLAGWVAWSLGDATEGQEALGMALTADPEYAFAQLLHHACAEDMDPEPIRRCLRREERTDRSAAEGQAEPSVPTAPADSTGEPAGAAPRLQHSAGAKGADMRVTVRPRAADRPRGTERPRGSERPGARPMNRRRTLRRAARDDR
ncbi:DUF4192 domain-containing protein [Streptomyces sp. NPDC050658]|uniref:DUF4192 domain-containing protein n=1 Tax=unclassified Streptomyces TaxID=2593676 RepID=UPI0034309458